MGRLLFIRLCSFLINLSDLIFPKPFVLSPSEPDSPLALDELDDEDDELEDDEEDDEDEEEDFLRFFFRLSDLAS